MSASNKFADQIRNAVQDAVASQDYSGLQATIEQSVNTAADSIGRGIAQAQVAYKQAQEAQKTQQGQQPNRSQAALANTAQRQEMQKRNQAVYGSPNGVLGAGIGMTVFGGLLLAPTVPLGIISLVSGSTAASVFSLLGAIGGGALIFVGARFISLASRFTTYKKLIGNKDHYDVDELAHRTNDQPSHVLSLIRRMIDKNLFKQAALDRQQTTLILTSQAYEQYQQTQAQYQRRLRQENMAASVTPAPANSQGPTQEAKALLTRGEAYVAKIRLSNEAIPGQEISRKIDQIEHVVRLILQRAEEHPEVIDDLGQLMDYYLPTTVKLLDAYRELDAQPIQGDNIIKSKQEIEGALDSLAVAFEKLLDSVFRDMAWDVSSDISVLHTVLAQEGLVEDPFSPENNTFGK